MCRPSHKGSLCGDRLWSRVDSQDGFDIVRSRFLLREGSGDASQTPLHCAANDCQARAAQRSTLWFIPSRKRIHLR